MINYSLMIVAIHGIQYGIFKLDDRRQTTDDK